MRPSPHPPGVRRRRSSPSSRSRWPWNSRRPTPQRVALLRLPPSFRSKLSNELQESAMESSAASRTGVDPPHDAAAAAPRGTRDRARKRGAVLARMLAAGDVLAALAAAAIALLVLGMLSTVPASLVYILVAGLAWPLTAFSIGLYRSDQLERLGLGYLRDAARLRRLMLITWPLFGIASLLALGDDASALTFLTVRRHRRVLRRLPDHRARQACTASRDAAPAHADPRLRSGRRAGGREAPEQPASSASIPVGIVDDEVHDVGTPDLPWLGRLRDLDARSSSAQQIDRVIIAFSRASHEELLECDPGLPRRRRRDRRGAAPLRVPRRRPARSTRSAACRCSRSAPPT